MNFQVTFVNRPLWMQLCNVFLWSDYVLLLNSALCNPNIIPYEAFKFMSLRIFCQFNCLINLSTVLTLSE